MTPPDEYAVKLNELQNELIVRLHNLTGISESVLRLAILRVIKTQRAAQRTRAYVRRHPQFLTEGSPHTTALVQKLLTELADLHVPVVKPKCLQCGGEGAIIAKSGFCTSCNSKRYRYLCYGCGTKRRIAIRTDSGRLCSSCARRLGRFIAKCSICGNRRSVNIRTYGGPVCQLCSTLSEPCIDCHRFKYPRKRHIAGPLCNACHASRRRVKRTCPGCSDERIVNYSAPSGEIVCARCAKADPIYSCRKCGTENDLYGKYCAPCELECRLNTILPEEDRSASERNQRLYSFLRASPTPAVTARWLTQSASGTALQELLSRDQPITHEAIDSYPDQSAKRIRALFVAAGILAIRDDQIDRFSDWFERFLTETEPQFRLVVSRYARWVAYPAIHLAKSDGRSLRSACDWQRFKIRLLNRLLTHLNTNGHTLENVTQDDIDTFLAGQSSTAIATSALLNWANETKLAPIPGFRTPRALPRSLVSEEEHRRLLERLMIGSDIDLRTRITGLLVGLYGLPITWIARIARSDLDITDNGVHLSIGQSPLWLEDRLARLLMSYLNQVPRTEPASTDWIFPSFTPGHHIHPSTLTHNLRAVGFSTKEIRNAARLNIAAHVPVAVFSSLTGVAPNVAARWATVAGATWSSYPGLRSQTQG